MLTLPNKTRFSRKFFLKTSSVCGDRFVFRERSWSHLTLALAVFCLGLIFFLNSQETRNLISPLIGSLRSLTQQQAKNGYEVFGFAPFWKINDLDNVDFDTLTTFAYFGVPVTEDGSLDRADYGYTIFQSKKATDIFRKAHQHGTRVVLTITQMDNDVLDEFLTDSLAQKRAIEEAVDEVSSRGIDGINVDFEYIGNPGSAKRHAFSAFVRNLTTAMHKEVPTSRVTVSVYASSAKSPKLYDIKEIADGSDGIFMMAYDFAVATSDNAMPTAPLYGKKEGKYPYDIATAVDEFLALMPSNKLILGVPYYGYNYMVYEPKMKSATLPASWRGRSGAQTYEYASSNIEPDRTGWDELGQVGWQAYYVAETDTWRMLFLDDARSLSIKYDFAIEKQLQGVGMWALGFDSGKDELWAVLRGKFGIKNLAGNQIVTRTINEETL